MNIVTLLLVLLLAAVLVVFGAQNTQSVSFHFLGWETPALPVVLALAIALALGAVLSWIVSVPGRFRGMRNTRSLRHQVEDQERRSAPRTVEEPSEDREPSP